MAADIPTSGVAHVIAGAATAALGPALGSAALIIFGAVSGSMLAMSRTATASRLEAVKFVLVGVLIALAISGAIAWGLETYLNVPSSVAVMPISAVIGAARNSILSLMESTVGWLGNVLASFKRG